MDTSVLLYIRQGRAISELERHGRVVASEAPFVYFQSIDGAVSPHGFIRLSRESGRTIWIERTYGDGPPIDSMFAHVQLGPKYFAQYLYKGDTVQSHLSAAGAVEAYAAAGGIR